MSKRQLYFIICILAIVLLYVLFRPTTSESPVRVDIDPSVTNNEVQEMTATAPKTEPELLVEEDTESVTVDGVFVGLTENTGATYDQTFEYLLLDDGTEIISIDLRPLIGYDKVDVPAKLGVDRGDRVRLTGHADANGAFTIVSITPIE